MHPLRHVRIASGSTSSENHNAVRRFNDEPQCRVFLLQAGQAVTFARIDAAELARRTGGAA